jgi:hypothetical protein
MTAKPQWDEMVQLIVLWGIGETFRQPALDGIRELPGWAHLRRVATLADRAADRPLGHVWIDRTGDESPLVVLGGDRDQE